MRFAIIIPAFNEERHLSLCLQSLLQQDLLPQIIVVVDDSSTDRTAEVIKKYEADYSIITYVLNPSSPEHSPGSKVIKAFNRGLDYIDLDKLDIVCKFDADLIFPKYYLSHLASAFRSNKKLGLCGGVCTVKTGLHWRTENVTNLDHVRGALKSYRVAAFKSINGLAVQMGWDTADEFKLRFGQWEVAVLENLFVKHLKPTTSEYQHEFFEKQGRVFAALRYGLVLTLIAAIKLGLTRRQFFKFIVVLRAYWRAKKNNVSHLLSREEGSFLRTYRWNQIGRKLLP